MTQKCSFSRKKQETSFQIDDMPVGVSVQICTLVLVSILHAVNSVQTCS